jgi:hypothetical protein
MTKTLSRALQEWAEEFRAVAHADKLSIFRDHLRRLGLPNKPKMLLEGTIQIIFFCAAYATIDGQQERFIDFLKLQQYDPSQVPGARYAFTFDVSGKVYARVLVDAALGVLDLADLYNHPWEDYRTVGYNSIWITRTDWAELAKREKQYLEEQVEYDLRFDYAEDEVDFCFDDSINKRALFVWVQDHEEMDEGDGQGSKNEHE